MGEECAQAAAAGEEKVSLPFQNNMTAESTARASAAKPEIVGNWATLLLPLNGDESIDYALLEEELERFIAAGVNGIYSNGSAGEFYAQSEEEFDRIHALLAERCTARGVPFQIGVSHMSPQLSRERLRRVKSLRPIAVQVILPDWFPPTFDEIVDFCRVMAAEAAPVPLVLYNPPHAKRSLTPSEWAVLIERVPEIVGIKVPGGDDAWYEAMRPVLNRISVFIPGHTLASGLAKGAHGAYSNVACLNPAGAQRWYELCVARPEEGAVLEKRIQKFWFAEIGPLIAHRKLPNMAADKAAAAAGGWLPGFHPRLRWPYRSCPPEEAARIGAVARSELPEFFA